MGSSMGIHSQVLGQVQYEESIRFQGPSQQAKSKWSWDRSQAFRSRKWSFDTFFDTLNRTSPNEPMVCCQIMSAMPQIHGSMLHACHVACLFTFTLLSSLTQGSVYSQQTVGTSYSVLTHVLISFHWWKNLNKGYAQEFPSDPLCPLHNSFGCIIPRMGSSATGPYCLGHMSPSRNLSYISTFWSSWPWDTYHHFLPMTEGQSPVQKIVYWHGPELNC